MGKTINDETDEFYVETETVPPEEVPRLWRRYKRLPRNVFAISLVSLLNDISSEIINPFLPFFY
jgi:hypothetical protein